MRSRRNSAELSRMVRMLRQALIGLAERQLPEDPLPCFCVDYGGADHDEREIHEAWCEDARVALARSAAAAGRTRHAQQARPVVVTLLSRRADSGGSSYLGRA
jgi:hypothetical protein